MSPAKEGRGAPRTGGPKAKPRPGVQRARTTREKLLDAAAALFAERGYRTVTLDDIGGAVGVSGPAVYRHFKSKESLLGELLVDVSERLLSNAQERVKVAPGPAEALAALVDFHADFAVDNPALITVQSRELSSLAPDDQHRVRRLQRSYVEFWADVIVRAGRLERREEAMAAAHAIFGLLNSTPFSGSLDDQRLRALLNSMALGGLGPQLLDHPRQPVDAGQGGRAGPCGAGGQEPHQGRSVRKSAPARSGCRTCPGQARSPERALEPHGCPVGGGVRPARPTSRSSRRSDLFERRPRFLRWRRP